MAATVVTITRRHDRLGLRALGTAAIFVAGAAHIPPTPDHLAEVPYVGYLFVALSVACITGGIVLLALDSPTAWAVSGLACALAIVALVVSRTVGLPGMADDVGRWGEPMAVISLISETVVVALAAYALASRPPA